MKKGIFLVVISSLTIIVHAQKKECIALKVSDEIPRIDGTLDDSLWQSGEWCGDFIQSKPFENRKPSQQTQFKIFYDDDNLYVAIRCFDTAPDSIESRMSRRDEEVGDLAGIGFDSYFDKRTAFIFLVTAAGVKNDAVVTEDGNNWDYSWDPVWDVKTGIDASGWNAEMVIPLTQLRFGKQESYVWGLQVGRTIFRHGEDSEWQFISPNAPGWVSYFGELHGINNIVPKKQADITPYVVGRYDTYRKEVKNPFSKGSELAGKFGIDSKIGLTNDLTLDLTINPDFGQVEADPSEVNLSTFETYLQEKRPFFIEGKNILNFRLTDGDGNLSSDNIFYSRRIGRFPSKSFDLNDNEYSNYNGNSTILGAAKVTGKTRKGLSVGILESVTQREYAEVYRGGTETKEEVEPFTNYFVGRVQQDLNNSNTRVGAIISAVNRDLSDPVLKNEMINSAYSGGIDFSHQWKDKTYYFNFNAAFSQIRGTEAAISEKQTNAPHFFQRTDANHLVVDSSRTQISGYSGNVQFGRAGNGKWMFTQWVTWRSAGFNLNDVGYLRSCDEIQQVFWVGFRQNQPFSIFRNFYLNLNEWYGSTFMPETRYYGGNINANWSFKNYWEMGGGISRDAKSASPEALRGGPALLYDGNTYIWYYIESDHRKKIQLYFEGSAGIRDHQTSKLFVYSPGINIQFSDAFRATLEASYKRSMDKLAYVNNIDSVNFTRYIRGYINQEEVSLMLRLNYYITPDFSVQFYTMPFISAGKYSEYKYISDSKADDFNRRFILYNTDQITFDGPSDKYSIDENDDELVDYRFENPDFTRLDFNSNLVIRWEYKPGSVLFLVWTQNRNDFLANGKFSLKSNTSDLYSVFPKNVFLIKLSYRIGL